MPPHSHEARHARHNGHCRRLGSAERKGGPLAARPPPRKAPGRAVWAVGKEHCASRTECSAMHAGQSRTQAWWAGPARDWATRIKASVRADRHRRCRRHSAEHTHDGVYREHEANPATHYTRVLQSVWRTGRCPRKPTAQPANARLAPDPSKRCCCAGERAHSRTHSRGQQQPKTHTWRGGRLLRA